MGWTYQHKPDGITAKQFMQQEWTSDTERSSFRILKDACKLRTYYAQCERIIKATGERQVFAIVCLLNYAPSDHYNFGYKDMDESMGPCECDCPLDILEGLDPPASEYAADWRKRVLAYHASKKQLPKDGQWVQFAQPIKFTDGRRRSLFQCRKLNRKTYFVSDSDGAHVKITRRALQGEGVTVHNQKPETVAV